MIPITEFENTPISQTEPDQLGASEKLLLSFVSMFPGLKLSLKLSFYQRFLHFLKIIGIYLIEKNGLTEKLRSGLQQTETDRITQSLLQLLIQYEIVSSEQESLYLTKKYRQIAPSELHEIQNFVERKDETFEIRNTHLKKLAESFRFVMELIAYYRNHDHQIASQHARYKKLIDKQELDYEIRLSETLLQLTKLQLPHKIKSPFDDSYYTESGRNAFKNFTEKRFLNCLDLINQKNPVHSVLDIGCGYGNYIEATSERLPDAQITGIEMQKKVIRETQKRFAQNPNVSLNNKNIFDFEPSEKFDLTLLNYVLFYFSNEDKEKLFKQLHNCLNDTGSILVCQYYAGIEPLKKQLLKKQKEDSVSKRIGMFYGNKILYANALWNEASDAFIQSEIWQEFEQILNKCGFEIHAMTQADPFYYSLFVEIRKLT